MSLRHFSLLLLLGATWGLAFMFMRIAAPEFGAVALAATRIGLAALIMAGVVVALRQPLQLRKLWKTYLALGALNTAIPFVGYCFAALYIPSGYSAIANSTTPVWSALIAWLWFKEPLSALKWFGIAFAFTGVLALVGLTPVAITPMVIAGITATLIAAAMYAAAAFLIRHYLHEVSGLAAASGMVIAAALWLLPAGLYTAPAKLPSPAAWFAVATLAVVCTAAAYALFFYLLRAIGPQKASTTAFLFPAFAAFWGWLFLSEPITTNMLLGMGLVFAGTALITLGNTPTGATTQQEKIRDWLFWPLIYTFSPASLRRHILRRYQNGEHYFREEVNALRTHMPNWLPDADLVQACRDQRLVRFMDRADVFLSRFRLQHTLHHHVKQHNLPPSDRPQLLISAHFASGWWSLPGLSTQGKPVQMVLAPMPQPTHWLARLWRPYWALRWSEVSRLSGAPIIEKQGASKQIKAVLQNDGRVIALLDIPPTLASRCSPVHFFGQTAWMPRQSIDIALQQPNAELWTFFGNLDAETLVVHIDYQPLIRHADPNLILNAYAQRLEHCIRKRPGLWHAWGDMPSYFQSSLSTHD